MRRSKVPLTPIQEQDAQSPTCLSNNHIQERDVAFLQWFLYHDGTRIEETGKIAYVLPFHHEHRVFEMP